MLARTNTAHVHAGPSCLYCGAHMTSRFRPCPPGYPADTVLCNAHYGQLKRGKISLPGAANLPANLPLHPELNTSYGYIASTAKGKRAAASDDTAGRTATATVQEKAAKVLQLRKTLQAYSRDPAGDIDRAPVEHDLREAMPVDITKLQASLWQMHRTFDASSADLWDNLEDVISDRNSARATNTVAADVLIERLAKHRDALTKQASRFDDVRTALEREPLPDQCVLLAAAASAPVQPSPKRQKRRRAEEAPSAIDRELAVARRETDAKMSKANAAIDAELKALFNAMVDLKRTLPAKYRTAVRLANELAAACTARIKVVATWPKAGERGRGGAYPETRIFGQHFIRRFGARIPRALVEYMPMARTWNMANGTTVVIVDDGGGGAEPIAYSLMIYDDFDVLADDLAWLTHPHAVRAPFFPRVAKVTAHRKQAVALTHYVPTSAVGAPLVDNDFVRQLAAMFVALRTAGRAAAGPRPIRWEQLSLATHSHVLRYTPTPPTVPFLSPAVLPPERHPDDDAAAVYNAGVLLYRFLYGRDPMFTNSGVSCVTGFPPLAPRQRALRRLVVRMLDANPRQRPVLDEIAFMPELLASSTAFVLRLGNDGALATPRDLGTLALERWRGAANVGGYDRPPVAVRYDEKYIVHDVLNVYAAHVADEQSFMHELRLVYAANGAGGVAVGDGARRDIKSRFWQTFATHDGFWQYGPSGEMLVNDKACPCAGCDGANPCVFRTPAYCRLVGKVLAKAFVTQENTGLPMSKAFTRLLCAQQVEIDDLAGFDREATMVYERMLANKDVIEQFGLTWDSVDPSRGNHLVTSETLEAYVAAKVNKDTWHCGRAQVAEDIAYGFRNAFVVSQLNYVPTEQVHRIVFGHRTCTFEELWPCILFDAASVPAHAPLRAALHRALRILDDRERGQFVLFATGSSKIPANSDAWCITIKQRQETRAPPRARSCFREVEMHRVVEDSEAAGHELAEGIRYVIAYHMAFTMA